MKKLLTLIAILALVATPALAITQKATLINDNGKKIVVNVGYKIPYGYHLFKEVKLGAAQVNIFNSVTASSTITTAGKASIIMKANAGRHYAVITNTTGTIAYLAFSATTTPNTYPGVQNYEYVIPLAASGGSYVINLDNEYIGQIIASSSAAVTINSFEAK